ncbi:MAG: pirin family protein [Dehalococcoidia bacterium]|nr:pirin family protein [Dehalococcoidia bacterium]
MPAATTENILTLPRIPRPDADSRFRGVVGVVTAQTFLEGAGFQVRRPFPGIDMGLADPFLLLDHLGAVEYEPGEAKGAPWHPHRGFETVTYIIDGAMEHHDSTGGGGLISDGATQWMTAGAGILHDEVPPEWLVQKGGLFHGVQLWVNLPAAQKWTPPRYQDISSKAVKLLASHDGGTLVRLIAGELAGEEGPGATWTPIAYAHATVSPGARLETPWRRDFNAMAYVLSGEGFAGPERRPIREGQLAIFDNGEALALEASSVQASLTPNLEVLLLGGKPIREPIVFHGPFVMNTRDEIHQAIRDYHSGAMGQIPATRIDFSKLHGDRGGKVTAEHSAN